MFIVKMQSEKVLIDQDLDKFIFITSDFWNSSKQNGEMEEIGLEPLPSSFQALPTFLPPTLFQLLHAQFFLVMYGEDERIYLKVGYLIKA